MTGYQGELEEVYQERPLRTRRRSRYDRPRSVIVWTALLFGMIVGLAGGLYYAWVLQPVEDTDIAPWQLESTRDVNEILPDRAAYIIAIMLSYDYTGDLAQTVERLVDMRLPGNDPIQYVADLACRLARDGYVNNNSRRNALRAMMTFYQRQGKSGCADQIIMMESPRQTDVPDVIVLPTSTLVPPATKTPLPGGTPRPTPTPAPGASVANPTPSQSRSFDIVAINTFCSADIPGVIEVRVFDNNGNEIPGQPIRVRGSDESSTFLTGLKPERGPGYADFDMEEDKSYIIEMPGLSDPSSSPLVASSCFDEDAGEESVQSYRVVFRE